MDLSAEQRASLLIAQVRRTWNPPRYGSGTMADVAQTAMMQTIAFVLGPAALPEDLTENQRLAIDEGLELMNQELLSEG